MKKNNKGFSLVELIIVIAIMAILAGALAPALIKYIAKSRRSTDVSNAQTIATAVTNALSVEGAYDDAKGGTSYTINTDGSQLGSGDSFCSEVTDQLGTSKMKPKYVNTAKFKIALNSDLKSFKVYTQDKSGKDVELYPDVDDSYK
jgi:type IV pilus assembly protein PilA